MSDPCTAPNYYPDNTCPWKSLLNSTSIKDMETNFQLLLEKGVDLHSRSEEGFCHLLIVALSDVFGRPYPNLPVLDFLIGKVEFPREDKIDALEMAGAFILLANHSHQENFPIAYQYWRRALSLRLMDTEQCRPIFKTPTNSKNGQLSEWSTLDDINKLEQNPSQRVIQAFLVQLRIFSSISWNALYNHLIYRLSLEKQNPCLLSPLLDLGSTYLDTLLHSWRPHEKDAGWKLSCLVSQLFDFSILTYERFSQGDPPQLNSRHLLKLVDLILMSDPSYLYDCNALEAIMHTIKRRKMFTILSQHRKMITKEIKLSLNQRMPSGLRLLHIACRYPDQETSSDLRFLVSLGADPNVGDSNGNRVLHMLAVQLIWISYETGRLLKKLGAHVCPVMVNKDGKTPAQLWMERNNTQEIQDLPDWLRNDDDDVVPKLKCLAARVIHRYGVPNDETIIPATLISYITWH